MDWEGANRRERSRRAGATPVSSDGAWWLVKARTGSRCLACSEQLGAGSDCYYQHGVGVVCLVCAENLAITGRKAQSYGRPKPTVVRLPDDPRIHNPPDKRISSKAGRKAGAIAKQQRRTRYQPKPKQ